LKKLFLLIALTISSSVYAEDITFYTGHKEIKVYGISTEEFQALASIPNGKFDINTITKEFVNRLHTMGYIAAEGFVVSDHEIFLNQGLITIVNVFGISGKPKKAIENIAKRLVGKRPNVDELDETLADINALSGVDATFALEASSNRIMDPRGWTPKENTSHYSLVVKVADQAQSYGAISLDSTPRNLFQRNRATITQTFNSVLVGGDHIQGSITHIWGDDQKDQNESSVTYFVPLLENGLYAELYGSYTASKNEIQPNVTRDFQGTHFTGIIGYPILRSHNETLTILGGVGYQGEDQDSQPNASLKALTATLFYNHSDPEGNSFTSSITTTSGDASIESNTRENRSFNHLRLGAGYIHALNFIADDTELRLEGFGQLTNDSLPGAQKFILGGSDFLRGYPVGVYSGNNGASGTLEVGHKYFYGDGFLIGTNVKVFWDFGFVSNKSQDAISANRPRYKEIHSVGLASSTDIKNGYGVSGWVGVPLNKGNQGEHLGPTVYLRLTKSW
jgi:hemolysin activation/secretion protein